MVYKGWSMAGRAGDRHRPLPLGPWPNHLQFVSPYFPKSQIKIFGGFPNTTKSGDSTLIILFVINVNVYCALCVK